LARDGFLVRRSVDGLRAAAEAMFPENDLGAPDFRATRLVERTLEYMDELPKAQHRLLVYLFLVLELIGGLLAGRLSRFSKLPVQSREAAVRRWRASTVHLLRLLGDSLKATLTMSYASHPDVIAYLGEYRGCAHEEAEFPIRVDAGALAKMTNPTEPVA
jgi:hypothetical protein